MRIDPEFRSLIPPLLAEELNQLVNSILSEGCRDPLVVWQEEGILLDGHNRLSICETAGVSYETREISLPDRLEAMIWIRRNQISRRNLTDDQRAMNAAGLAELESEKARRERARVAGEVGGKVAGRGRPKEIGLSTAPSDKPIEPRPADGQRAIKAADLYHPAFKQPPAKPKTDTRQAAARSAGVSERKVRQAQEVKRSAPALAAKVQSGEMSLASATREVKREAIVAKLEDIKTVKIKELAGVYDVLVIDPPWPMQKIERDERPNQSEFDYPTMTEEELESLGIPCAEDCHVWLWTTHKFLPMAFRLLDKWGLKYVCTFVWHKPGGFQPIGLPQYNCEFALYARRGTPQFIDTKALPTCFQAPRGAHSEKPEAFYEMVRRVTAGVRGDMFNRRLIDGFIGHGKEAA
jgi:N6-adenosine-specific RNA methylase IME4